jgi:thioesterase-3
METKYELTVSEEDIDELGHVNNVIYIRYLESARIDWYKKVVNMSFAEMNEKGLGTVLVHLDVTYKKEALLNEKLTIVTKPKKMGTKSFTYEQEIYNEKDENILEAEATLVMFDRNKRVGIPVIEEFAKHFK